MPQIVTKTYFQKSNWLYLPLSQQTVVANPTLQNPNNVAYIDNLCIEVERSLLLNSLGVDLYNRLQLALPDLNNPVNASYKKLVEGETYQNKIWRGLKHDYNLIACKIKEVYLRDRNQNLSQGMVQLNPEKATLVSSNPDIVKCNQWFINQYQGENTKRPKLVNNVLSWIGTDANEVSLFRYLNDRQTELVWDASKFVFDGIINDMGL